MSDNSSGIKMDFTGFMTGLLAEGFVSLGVMKNPVTGEARKDLKHAGLVIDTIDMLREKTKGNLSKEESDTLEESLHQLRVMFVQAVQETGKTTGEVSEGQSVGGSEKEKTTKESKDEEKSEE